MYNDYLLCFKDNLEGISKSTKNFVLNSLNSCKIIEFYLKLISINSKYDINHLLKLSSYINFVILGA